MREYLQDSAQNYIINIKRNDFIVKTHKKLNKFLIIIPIPVPPKYAIIFSNQCRQYGDSSSVALFGNGKEGFYEHVRGFNTAVSSICSINIHR